MSKEEFTDQQVLTQVLATRKLYEIYLNVPEAADKQKLIFQRHLGHTFRMPKSA
jgi:hypothetical protein